MKDKINSRSNDKINTKQEADALLCAVLDGDISKIQVERLIELARTDKKLKYKLFAQLESDHLLTQYFEHEDHSEALVESILGYDTSAGQNHDLENKVLHAISLEEKNTYSLNTPSSRYSPWWAPAISIAACCIVMFAFMYLPLEGESNGGGFSFVPNERIREVQDTGVAVIANVINVSNEASFLVGDSIKPGELKLRSGFLELEFYRGAVLKISGPAHLNIINEARVRLYRGKVMTDVPEVAIGFTIDTPNAAIVDLGTKIGVQVNANGQSQVHVFEGLAEARNVSGHAQRINKGDALTYYSADDSQWLEGKAKNTHFSEFNTINGLRESANEERHAKWLAIKEKVLSDPTLETYYDFEKVEDTPRVLSNIAKKNNKASDGAIVGAKWSTGPWQGKSALDFKRAGDRVRVNIEGQFQQFTLAAWVKIDSLDRYFNSLLLTDGYKKGDVHWQITKNKKDRAGNLLLGLSSTSGKARNYQHGPFFKVEESGTWNHLASSVNNLTGEVKFYINGMLVNSKALKFDSKYWQIGQASIGNWDPVTQKKPLRNLNGSMAEMMIFSRALNDTEVKELALK